MRENSLRAKHPVITLNSIIDMKPGTFCQISVHSVFAVKYREALISTEWRDEFHRYISGIIQKTGAKPLAVGGWLDHVHAFFGL